MGAHQTLMEKEMAAHSSILTWKITQTEELGGLQSMGLQRVPWDCSWVWQGPPGAWAFLSWYPNSSPPLMCPIPSLMKHGLRGHTSCLSHGSVIKINDAALSAPGGRLCTTVNFSAYRSPWCFPYRPVSFPETQQRVDSYTIYRVLGMWGCAKGFNTDWAVSSTPGGTSYC